MSPSADNLPQETLPTELGCEVLADGVRLQLRLDPDLPWLAGHFPGAPLLPGVTQIHWVMHYAASLLKLAQPFHGVDQLKFQRPLRPGAECSLRLQWQADKDQLLFQYLLGDEPASSGRVRLIP